MARGGRKCLLLALVILQSPNDEAVSKNPSAFVALQEARRTWTGGMGITHRRAGILEVASVLDDDGLADLGLGAVARGGGGLGHAHCEVRRMLIGGEGGW